MADTIPIKITALTTYEWSIDAGDYTASDSWIGKLTLINSTTKKTYISTNDGGLHKFTIPADSITNSQTGDYTYQIQVSKSGSVYQIMSGSIDVVKNLSDSSLSSLDNRSHVKKVLDSLTAVIEARATSADYEVEIATESGSRKVKNMSLDQLLYLRERYKSLYNQELTESRIANGEINSPRRLVRFR